MPVVNPGIRRQVAGAITRLFNSASFSAPLTHSLVPERGTGSPTFTRASTATVMGYGPTDNAVDGLKLLTVAANEARFVGARRISEGVWSNTFADGSLIPAATNTGYLAEEARTNLCLQSNAFTTTWTDGGAAAAQDATGPDGATSAWTLTDDSAVSTESRYQAITLTAADHVLSIFVGKTVGAQSSYPVLMLTHTGDAFRAIATIDTTNGVITPWTAVDGSTIVTSNGRCVSYNDDLWRAELTFTGTAAAWNLYIAPAATANASQSTGTFDATATGSAVFYGAQLELGSFASSYIATTTVAVQRNADVLTYSSAGNIDGTKGWCYAEISADWDTPPPSNYCAMGFGTSIEGLITGSVAGLPTEIRAFDGTNSAQQAGNPTMYRTPRNTAVTWGGSSMSVGQSGVVTAGSFDGNIGTTAIGVGNSGAGAFQWFGTIRNVRIGQRQLSASELGAITS